MTKRFRILWTDTAVNDLLAIVDYIALRDSVESAADVHARIMGVVQGLETMPQRCRVVPELHAEGIAAYRELHVGPYRIMFGVRGTDVAILAAVHGRRDLGELLIERALRQTLGS